VPPSLRALQNACGPACVEVSSTQSVNIQPLGGSYTVGTVKTYPCGGGQLLIPTPVMPPALTTELPINALLKQTFAISNDSDALLAISVTS
jgi:hypothetical protein